MERYTIFWSHPYQGKGSFMLSANGPEGAAVEAAQSLGEDLADDDGDNIEIAMIIDDLNVDVYQGEHYVRPANAPIYVLE